MFRPTLQPCNRLTILAAAAMIAGCTHSRPSSQLPPAKADSVDVPYGTQSTRDHTGSVGTVDGETARRTGTTNIADMYDCSAHCEILLLMYSTVLPEPRFQ